MILENMAIEYKNAQQMLKMAEDNPEFKEYCVNNFRTPFASANKQLLAEKTKGERRKIYERFLPDWAETFFDSDKAKEYVAFLEAYKKYIVELKNKIDQLNDKIRLNRNKIKISRQEWLPIIANLLKERYNRDYELQIHAKDFGKTIYKEYRLASGDDIRKIFEFELVKKPMTDKQFEGFKGCMFLTDEVMIDDEQTYMSEPIMLHIGSIRNDNWKLDYPVEICDREITEMARDYFINLIEKENVNQEEEILEQ